MTSKNSFLASLRENNKRRVWLWLLSVLGFAVMLPSFVAMSLSRMASDTVLYVQELGEEGAREYIRQVMRENVMRMLGLDDIMLVMIGLLAVISAIHGFSYLYSRQKIDFYLGMPVKRKKRFFIIWLNGILIYLIPYLAGLVAGGIVAAAYGVMEGKILREMMFAYGMNLCYYLGMYHLGILAVMLTGNALITLCGVGVFVFYELIVRIMLQGYMSTFFRFFSDFGYSVMPVMSPFAIFETYMDGRRAGEGNPYLTALYLLLFALAAGGISYLLYLKRPGEAVGRAMVFPSTCLWIKLMLCVPASLLAGLAAADIVGYRPLYSYSEESHIGLVIFFMALALLVTGCLMQVIFEFDIRGALHKKRQLLAAAVITAAVFCIFRFDLVGYDTYLPDVEEVESAIVIPGGAGGYGNPHFDEELNYISHMQYAEENMNLTDIGTVNKLVKQCIDAFRQKGQDPYEQGEWRALDVVFRLKNNREIYRSFMVNTKDPQTVELLDDIESSEEFQSGKYMALSPVVDKLLSEEESVMMSYYDNGAYRLFLSRQNVSEFLELYRQDLRQSDFSSLSASLPMGYVLLNFSRKMPEEYQGVRNQSLKLYVYPFFENSLSYLKEKDFYVDGYFKPEDVERIQVTNHHYDEREASAVSFSPAAEAVTAETAIEQESHVSYQDREEIRQLADCLYPSEMWNDSYWCIEPRTDNNYSVFVYLKPDAEFIEENVIRYHFLRNEVPEFVERDTAYTER